MTPAGRAFFKFVLYVGLAMLGMHTLMPWLYDKFGADNIANILFCGLLYSMINDMDKTLREK